MLGSISTVAWFRMKDEPPSVQQAGALPEDAGLIEERNGISVFWYLEKYHDLDPFRTEKIAVVDGERVLTTIWLGMDSQVSIARITDEYIVLFEKLGRPGTSGYIYTISRRDGSVISTRSGGYFFTAPDDSYFVDVDYSGTAGTPSQAIIYLNDSIPGPDRSYNIGPYRIGSMSLSPDGKHIVVLAVDEELSSQEKEVFVVFVVDIKKDARKQVDTPVGTFELPWEDGPGYLYEMNIAWESDTRIVVSTESDNGDYYREFYSVDVPN